MATLIKILDNAKFFSKTVFNDSPSGGSSLTNGLQAFYKLDDLTDSSGNGNTLTNNGNVSFASGKIGNAAVFSQGNSLSIASEPNLCPTTSGFTVAAWCYIPSYYLNVQAFSPIYKWRWQTGEREWWIGNYNENAGEWWAGPFTHLCFKVNNDGNDTSADGQTMARLPVICDEWIYVVGVYNGASKVTSLKIYSASGVQVAESQPNDYLPLNGTSDVVIAGSYDDATPSYVDAVGIWNRALSDAEVAALYNSGNGLELN